jgi:hypothetical protein
MRGRPILYKQLSYRFYRGSALPVAQTITDIPLSAARTMVFSIIVYFMCGLERNAGAFLTFFLFIYLTFLTMVAFFRLVSVFVYLMRSSVDHLVVGWYCLLRICRCSSVGGCTRHVHGCLRWLHDPCRLNETLAVLALVHVSDPKPCYLLNYGR